MSAASWSLVLLSLVQQPEGRCVPPATTVSRTLYAVTTLDGTRELPLRCYLIECDQLGSCWSPLVLPDGRKQPLKDEDCRGALTPPMRWRLPGHQAQGRPRSSETDRSSVPRPEACARSGPTELEAAKRDQPPRANEVRIRTDWKSDPAEGPDAPCRYLGAGGAGPFRTGVPGWIRCTYRCGEYQVTLYDVRGNSTDDCDQPAHLARARREAQHWAAVNHRDRSR